MPLPVSVFLRFLSVLLLIGTILRPVDGVERVRLVIDHELPPPAKHAVDRLTDALMYRGFTITTGTDSDPKGSVSFVIGVAGHSEVVDDCLTRHRLSAPEPAESLLITRLPSEDNKMFLFAGRDARGLAYAVHEVGEAIRLASAGSDPLTGIREARESPHLRMRSVTTQVFNQNVERAWYESEEYWHWFFDMLVRNRFNNYSLTIGHNTNHMVPPYAWLFEVSDYPEVRVKGVDDKERERNLHMFRRISEIAQEYGVDFTIGLWTQLPVVQARVGLDYGESPVENLPTGMQGGDYCAKGLRKLLELCPAVTGVQLRMNLESGIPHEQQEAYYRSQFDAIANCGRPVRLDMRYKSLSQRTIDLAENAGLDVTVSTKFWCEHMGLPYHPTWQDPAYSVSRYGYGSMLHHPRNYRVVYRLWTVGTSRLLLWGDPQYASRLAQSCTMGGGEGFEVLAPLANKGYGNEPGQWRIFADESLEYFEWEYERYWAFFLAFGRYGYRPDSSVAVWQREFIKRFGKAGPHMERAYREASQILPLITATTQFSAGSWRFWPELLPCMHLDAYRAIQPSDYSQFYAIAPWSSRQDWRAEGWAAKHSAFVEDAIAGNLNSKWTPIEVSKRLSDLADAILSAIEEARAATDGNKSREFQATELDMRVLAHIARYHAAKKLAATHLEFFRLTNDKLRLPLVWKHVKRSQDEWKKIVKLTDGKYFDQMVFGFSHHHHSDFPDRLQVHVGHWKDRLSEVQADVDFVAGLLRDNNLDPDADVSVAEQTLQRFPGEVPLRSKPVIEHERVAFADPGQDLRIVARVTSERPLRDVSVYYRVMDQTQPWRRLPLKPAGDGTFAVSIPGSQIGTRFDLLYYLEARGPHGGTFWPKWQRETPYVIVSIRR